MKTATPPVKLSTDAESFLETLLWVAVRDTRETDHIKNWTVHEFHPEFVAALETFLSGFRKSLAKLPPGLDPDECCNRSFGGNVFFSLSGHGVGFWDERENGDELQAALEAYSGNRHRFEALDGNLSKFHGKIHLAYRTAALRREYLAKTFGGVTIAPLNMEQAHAEGWVICDVDSSGYLEIEVLEREGKNAFPSDYEAACFVKQRANAGSEYHTRAVSIITENRKTHKRRPRA